MHLCFQKMKKNNTIYKKYFDFTCVLLVSIFVFYQEISAQSLLSGHVKHAETEQPLKGVTIISEKSGAQTTTDSQGNFSILAFPANSILQIRSVGFETQIVAVTYPTSHLEILLKEENQYLNEVIITGYTSQQRKSISGSIATVQFDEQSQNQADLDAIKLLQGKAPGVQISSTSGSPGGGISFLIRGNSSIGGSVEPLYVVDGIFISTQIPVSGGGGNLLSNPIADINPSDIETITILKDANATAIYGSQGSNGVVLITTKRGKRNSPTRINLHAKEGVSQNSNEWKIASGPQSGQLLLESWKNTAEDNGESLATYLNRERPTNWNQIFPFTLANGSPDFSQDNIENLPTYNRVETLFKEASAHDYQLSFAGGNAQSNHYIGIGYSEQESIVKPNDFNRFSGRINYDNQVREKLKVGVSFNLVRTGRTNVRNSDNDPTGIIGSAIFPRSFLPIYDENGDYLNHATFNNHLRLIDHLDNDYVTWRNTVNFNGEYAILPSLKFKSSWSFDLTNNTARNFSDFAISNTGSASASNQIAQVYSAEQLLNYAESFNGQHDLHVLLGNTILINQNQGLNASGNNFIFDVLREVSSGANTSGGSFRSENRLVSFFGKASYTYNSKYALELSFRADGSSRFGQNVRWGYFPAIGATWNVHKESFLNDSDNLSLLQIRSSYGITGNQNGIGNYDALAIWNTQAQSYLDLPSLSPGRLGNPNLTWETTTQSNLGLDLGLFNNALTFHVDAYYKYTKDGLQAVNVPSRSGYSTALLNYSEISNRGLEFQLIATPFKNDSWNWSSSFNLSANRNRIEKIPQEQTLGATNRGTSILREGYPVNSFFLYKQLYVDPLTGNAVYDDLDKNGVINYADRQIVGSTEPDFQGGFTQYITYKNFDLNVFFHFTKGNNILNLQQYFMVHGGTQNGIGFDARQLDRWQNPGDVTDIPRLTRYNKNPELNNSPANNYLGQVASLSSRYLDDGSFVRLKNLAFGYTFPAQFTDKIGVNRLKATISATNLWILTAYKGVDPEVSAQSANQNTAGYDWATIPQPKTIEAILNITF